MADPEAVDDGAAELVEAAVVDAAADVAAIASAVALRVPHCSFVLQTDWA